MSYSEFPHYDDNDKRDLRELIDLYKELVGKYSGTLSEIQDVNKRLDDYIANQDAAFAKWKNDMLSAVDDRVKADIAPLIARQNAVEQQVASLQDYIDSKVREVNDYVDIEIGRLQSSISAVEKLTNLNTLRLQTINADLARGLAAEQVARNEAIASAVAEVGQRMIDSIDEVNNRIDDIECASNVETMRWLWDNAIGCCGINAIKWYFFTPFTCKDWNDCKITCIEWYTDGIHVTGYDKYQEHFLSPVTGKWVDAEEGVTELARLVRPCGISAGEYDMLKVRAGDYDSKAITAYKYDMCGKEIIKNEFGQNS